MFHRGHSQFYAITAVILSLLSLLTCSFYFKTLKLLERLNRTIQKALSLIQDTRRPFEECSPLDVESHYYQIACSEDGRNEQAEADDSPWEISSISDDEDDDDDYDKSNNQNYPKTSDASFATPVTQSTATYSKEYSQFALLIQKPNKEMPQLLESIGFIISCLNQLPVRRVTPFDRFGQKELSIDAHLHQPDDMRYVKDIFPQLGPNVEERIGKMISRHRLLFHFQPSDKDLDSLESPYLQDEFDPLSSRQIFEVGPAQNKHATRSFQLYVCTYEDCDLFDQVFESRDEWDRHETQSHRVEWFCNYEGHPAYAEQSELLAHMKCNHDRTINAGQLSLLASIFQRPTRSLDGTCNLCLNYSEGLKSHVSRHFEEIAQFAHSRAKGGSIGEKIKLSSQIEQSLPIGFHDSRLEEPNIDDSAEEVIVRDTEDSPCSSVPITKPFKAEITNRDLEIAPERDHNAGFKAAPTSPRIFSPKLQPESVKAKKIKNESENNLALAAGLSLEKRSIKMRGFDHHMKEDLSGVLYSASATGDEPTVKSLLRLGVDIKGHREMSEGALQAASRNGHESTVALLLIYGADVNAQGKNSSSALTLASNKGHESIVKLLLENGADVNAQCKIYGSALQVASGHGHESIVALLLKHWADINAQGGSSSSALTLASAKGHESIVNLLLWYGADVNAQGKNSNSALTLASAKGHESIVKLLLEKGADVNFQNENYGSALRVASMKGHESIVRLLLENGADVDPQNKECGNALQMASANGYESIVRMLLRSGANIDNFNGSCTSALIEASAKNHKNVVETLLRNGAEVNLYGKYAGSALHAALARNHENIVDLLLEYGAVDIDGRGTPAPRATLLKTDYRPAEWMIGTMRRKFPING